MGMTDRLEIRIDQETKEKIKRLCNESRGMTQSKVIRKAILDCKIEPIRGKAEIVFLLKKIGTNVNQISRKINSNIFSEEEMKKYMDMISDFTKQLELLNKKYQ